MATDSEDVPGLSVKLRLGYASPLASGGGVSTIAGMTEIPPTTCDLSIRVRYPESDPMGYLHHSKFFEYFEMGRIELLRKAGFSYRDLEDEGCYFAVVRIECRFRSPGRFDDELVLTTKMDRMTRARIDHSYVLRRGDVVLCDANSTIACVDRRGKLQPIPEKIFVEVG